MMYTYFILIFFTILYFNVEQVKPHGMVMEPVNRASAFRKGFKTKADYNDNGHMCGFSSFNHPVVPGSCRPCGVPSFPKSGPIVKSYSVGSEITIEMKLTANHKGWATFKICPEQEVTEACFNKHPLTILNSPQQSAQDKDIRFQWTGTKLRNLRSKLNFF